MEYNYLRQFPHVLLHVSFDRAELAHGLLPEFFKSSQTCGSLSSHLSSAASITFTLYAPRTEGMAELYSELEWSPKCDPSAVKMDCYCLIIATAYFTLAITENKLIEILLIVACLKYKFDINWCMGKM